MSFPRKEQRTKCYSARDELWQCLDQNQDKDEKAANSLCAQFKAGFEEHCPSTWVLHFERKYKYLKFKEKMEAGYDPVEEGQTAKSNNTPPK